MPYPKRILIANRGTAATRIMRCCAKLNIPFVTVYSLEDCDSLHVNSNSVCLHDKSSLAVDTYLNQDALFKICEEKQCDAIHPGYGFLSENADFANECEKRNVVFIGPTPKQISSFGLKHSARELAEKYNVPLLPGSGLLENIQHAKEEANRIGYPVLLKCVAGGGGIGMKICDDDNSLSSAFDSVKRLAKGAFKDDGVFLEKFLPKARHVEVQIFGDGKGNVVALGERDCSTQRRNQKVIEESPAPYLTDEIRRELWESAIRLAKGVGYRSAGTVEYIVDAINLRFYFLEVNTRVQVEHGVTEQVYTEEGVYELDIIEWMIKTAAGELDLSSPPVLIPQYHSIQCRIYAEDANKNFQPAAGGILTAAEFPSSTQDVRIETWIRVGTRVSSLYDPMIAKLICRGRTREEARTRLLQALGDTNIAGGVECNIEFLEQAISSDAFSQFKSGLIHTHWLSTFTFIPKSIDVVEPGTQTSIQDYPGRIGYWAPGVPPSGPMDHFAFRLANRLVGNPEGAAALEMTIQGPTLKFNSDVLIALTGPPMEGDLDGEPIRFNETLKLPRGSILRLEGTKVGCRAYLAVSGGGFEIPEFLGSKSTFALGKFGGHAGRTLIHGDVLHLSKKKDLSSSPLQKVFKPLQFTSSWEIRVLMGPHSAPDFFKESFISSRFFNENWTVHYNSNRLGIRLSGPKPEFTRLDGGEAGLHPSNIHDTVYAIGTINFTGDMPVILGLDGPSLGGFVCPCTIVKADLWKIGQLRPGDVVKFVQTNFESALAQEKALDDFLASGKYQTHSYETNYGAETSNGAVVRRFVAASTEIEVVYRQAGDHNILIEYGELILDLKLRCRVHALMKYLEKHAISGIIEVSPGVRSVQVHFDSRKIASLQDFLDKLEAAEKNLETVESMVIESRVINLPLSFEASSTLQAINKYRQSVRDKAPWLPSNIEFIRRINGLDSQDQVRANVFNSNFLVLGLGDVYLGAPCAVPLDPRHRLLTTKYNPARTWTEEGEVGIGGVFMCIYGMQSPGGYQLIGRTIPIWNNYPKGNNNNWLLRSFDQVRFYPVSENVLMDCRRRLSLGDDCSDLIRIKNEKFNVKDYLAFLDQNRADVEQFQGKQRLAFEKERDSWTKDDDYVTKQVTTVSEHGHGQQQPIELSQNEIPVRSQISGNIWAVNVKPGDVVEKGDTIVVVEAMKLEINVPALQKGKIHSVYVQPGTKCSHGDLLVTFRKEISFENGIKTSNRVIQVDDLQISSLQQLYFGQNVSVVSVMSQVLERIDKAVLEPRTKSVFISRRTNEDILQECHRLDRLSPELRNILPLFGIPFVCKDNIDYAGLPTTCACPAFSFLPETNSTVVELLIKAGAVLIGKANMDQFAAGLVGARSPYGICTSVINDKYVSGGSSSGSAVAVAARLVSFSLGTDTAGSGRVPAMFNNLVGLKPSRGLVSNKGVVPACQSLDCVSIFANQVDDAERILNVIAQPDEEDPYSRLKPCSAETVSLDKFKFGIPSKIEFFGNSEMEQMFNEACSRFTSMGGSQLSLNFTPFADTAALLYQGPWVAERLEALEPFFSQNQDKIHPTTWEIISKGQKYTAVDCFKAYHKLEGLKREAWKELEKVDFLLVPTAPAHYTVEQVLADPIKLNSNLGIYTNFVNLLDLSALAIPTGHFVKSSGGMPFGVTLVAKTFKDEMLISFAKKFARHLPIDLAVVGAHLSGMPLNFQLTQRGANLVRQAKTAKGKYRLYALNQLKPGLVKTAGIEGVGIEVEIWRFPNLESFGSFVSDVPVPLSIGTIELDDGCQVKSFLCEQYAVSSESVKDITSFGGWKAFKEDVQKV